jgi:Multiubiquitin
MEGKAKTYKISVNGVEKTVDKEVLSYDNVVAFVAGDYHPDTIFSVTFDKAREPKEGELVKGQTVTIKNNTEFDVVDTGRS